MKHSSHEHALVLNENYIAREGDICCGCSEQILSCKLFVYSCSRITSTDTSSDTSVDNRSCANFLLHKNCAELPACIQHPLYPGMLLYLFFDGKIYTEYGASTIFCDICRINIWNPTNPIHFFYCFSSDIYSSDPSTNIYTCLKCVMFKTQQSLEDPKFKHPSHDHLLSLIQHPSSFKCDACNVDDNIRDMSCRCTRCQFWIHKSCADAPTTFQFHFHNKHPLSLSFTLPQVYRKFRQYCGLCTKILSELVWIYYCRKCRFFTHFQCARSNQMMISSCENGKNDSDLVHLPPADESSVNLLCKKFVKATISLNNNIDDIFSSIDGIKHWSHEEHHLQVINSNELNNQQDDDGIILLCDGCVKPIGSDEGQFYGCVPCKYYLHKFCAELPKEIKRPFYLDTKLLEAFKSGFDSDNKLWEEIKRILDSVYASKLREPYRVSICFNCGVSHNGIFFEYSVFQLDIGCITLPKMIKHEAHPHKLKYVLPYNFNVCKACGKIDTLSGTHKCEQCDYRICGSCIMKAKVAKHPWDPHPLHLIYEPGMVMQDHEHDFNCEFCSKDIDTNNWFYHCSDCDLSFHHGECFEKSSFRRYSNVKFGATDIVINKLHPHKLTFVLNKKVRRCEKCHKNQLGEPVLECPAPCKSIVFCTRCIKDVIGEPVL